MAGGRLLTFGPADSRHTLADERWCRASTVWQTVIPMELPRHVAKRREWNRDDWDRISAEIGRACFQADLPVPLEVEASNTPFAIGSPNARNVRGPHRRPVVQARVLFPHAVEGPIVVGRRQAPRVRIDGAGGDSPVTFPDFARFFELCHDEEPYLWQRRLADEVLTDKRWPPALDLPTGSGKDLGNRHRPLCTRRGRARRRIRHLPSPHRPHRGPACPRRSGVEARRATSRTDRVKDRACSGETGSRQAESGGTPEQHPAARRLSHGPAVVPFPGPGPDRRLDGRPDRLAASHARLRRLAAHAIRGGRPRGLGHALPPGRGPPFRVLLGHPHTP